jgi:dTDP-4-dehydrorhamnose reductase
MKIIIIGSNGQVGMNLSSVLNEHDLILATHNDVEIKNKRSVFSLIKNHKPHVVINTAAFHNVEKCEKNHVKAFRVNAIGAKYLALACSMIDAVLLHISTDYVFDGKKKTPYDEDDIPNPLNTYGITKLAGEYYIRGILKKYFIVRTSGLYGKYKCRAKGGNFVERMIFLAQNKGNVKVVDDEILTPTYTFDLSLQIKKLIETNFYGTYHITNNGFCSWYEFAKRIFELKNICVNLESAKSKEFAPKVKRPLYSVLENKKLKSLNMDIMPMWDDALKRFLKGEN